ncbi:MAG: trypsin-like peptidase domain-containing protein [Cyanobacteria bacterium J06641_5]
MTREAQTTQRHRLGLYVGLLALGGWIGVLGGYALSRMTATAPAPAVPSVQTDPTLPLAIASEEPLPIPTSGRRELNFVAQAAERVGPAVVRVDAIPDGSAAGNGARSPWRRFFGSERDESPSSPRRRNGGSGTGFIFSADGHILTNAHVIDDADRVQITLRDGRSLPGRVIGSDRHTDIAAIAVDAEDLPTVRFGRSTQLVPGDWAIAIGNPLGLNHTVTVGIVSALDRSSAEVGVRNKRVRYIQTDAAINPGNSGGPLLDAGGNVIGINTAIRANAQGLGFAIPIETAARIAGELFASGHVDHPYLGIQMVGLSPELRERFNETDELPELTLDQGVLIAGVVADSPAEKAGLQKGDILLSVGELEVKTPVEVQERVDRSQIGEPLAVEVNRGGRVRRFEVLPGVLPDEP